MSEITVKPFWRPIGIHLLIYFSFLSSAQAQFEDQEFRQLLRYSWRSLERMGNYQCEVMRITAYGQAPDTVRYKLMVGKDSVWYNENGRITQYSNDTLWEIHPTLKTVWYKKLNVIQGSDQNKNLQLFGLSRKSKAMDSVFIQPAPAGLKGYLVFTTREPEAITEVYFNAKNYLPVYFKVYFLREKKTQEYYLSYASRTTKPEWYGPMLTPSNAGHVLNNKYKEYLLFP
jgi:hypothetical protein